ncbi:MAG: site-specific integrase [Meiothermus sp.]|nr:site-specific integrase [Meiothermus sp.]
MPRRGKGEGSIFQRKDGRWAAFITVGYGPDGKQRKKWVYGQTRREVAEKLARLLPKAGYNLLPATPRLTLGQWLTRWAEERTRNRNLRPATVSNYQQYLRYLEPLGHIPLARLSPLALRGRFAELAHLSPSVRRHLYQFARAALRDAVRLDLLQTNPMDAVDPPKGGAVRPARAWRPEEASRFLETCRTHRLYPLFYLMLTTGLRVGEALALRWEDWQGDTLHVRHTLRRDGKLGPAKTEASVSGLYLDAQTQGLLAQHRQRQAEERATASRWREHGLIFPSEVGTPISYRNLIRTWKALVAKAGVPYIPLHGLRHTYTSLAFRAGLNPKQVADRLRHKDPTLAVRTYQHLEEEDRKRAALELEALLQRPREK